MNVEVTKTRKEKIKDACKCYGKYIITGVGLVTGGILIASGMKKTDKVTLPDFKYGEEFLDEVFKVGEGADGATTSRMEGVTLGDLGMLGEKIVNINGRLGKGIDSDSEVVGAVVYYKK